MIFTISVEEFDLIDFLIYKLSAVKLLDSNALLFIFNYQELEHCEQVRKNRRVKKQSRQIPERCGQGRTKKAQRRSEG